jgi:hypothetical protein
MLLYMLFVFLLLLPGHCCQPQDCWCGAVDLPGPVGQQDEEGRSSSKGVRHKGQSNTGQTLVKCLTGSSPKLGKARCARTATSFVTSGKGKTGSAVCTILSSRLLHRTPITQHILYTAASAVFQVFDNVLVQPRDAREASDVFYRQRLGDVLLTYENEVVLTNQVRPLLMAAAVLFG